MWNVGERLNRRIANESRAKRQERNNHSAAMRAGERVPMARSVWGFGHEAEAIIPSRKRRIQIRLWPCAGWPEA
jgi:hypothetical protein